MNERVLYLAGAAPQAERPLEILLVEDNAGDARLMREVLRESRVENRLSVVTDGEMALAFLRREACFQNAARPDLMLLDLNLPRKDGRQVLREIKSDPALRRIPVLVLSTSEAEADIQQCYDLHANCYIRKPLDLDEFIAVMRCIEEFWLRAVKLPSR